MVAVARKRRRAKPALSMHMPRRLARMVAEGGSEGLTCDACRHRLGGPDDRRVRIEVLPRMPEADAGEPVSIGARMVCPNCGHLVDACFDIEEISGPRNRMIGIARTLTEGAEFDGRNTGHGK